MLSLVLILLFQPALVGIVKGINMTMQNVSDIKEILFQTQDFAGLWSRCDHPAVAILGVRFSCYENLGQTFNGQTKTLCHAYIFFQNKFLEHTKHTSSTPKTIHVPLIFLIYSQLLGSSEKNNTFCEGKF